ncbi:MAG TPA: efflux RND transporter periplasmic adaptor subunit [Bryobacteraceae bacterium]|nr:efflux RND transporter periplasmic adaptor subunit [Bryobacteraceae bacterium]
MGNPSETPDPVHPETKEQALLPEAKQPALLAAGKPATSARRRRWLWVAGALLALLIIFLMYRSGTFSSTPGNGATQARQPAGAAITVAKSTTGNMNIYVDALGTVTPVYTVTLYSQITGQVIAVHYREGQMVKKGDPLVDVDPRPYQSTLTQAQGALERDQGLLAEARMDLQRYQAAWAKNGIPKQQLDDQEKVVIQDEGTVKADQGTVEYDQVQLSYCHIVSPITGRVGLRLVDPGNTVFSGSSSTLVVITQLQPITIVFDVSEDDLPQVQAQLNAGHTLVVDAFDRANEKEIEAGKLTSLDNEVDTATGTIKFRGEFPNRHLALFPNQFVNARLLVKTLTKVTLVPSAAVQHNGTSAFVYVVNPGNKVSVQNITVLSDNDQESAVQGLNPGVTVATSGFDRLENGVEVTIRGQPAPGNNSGQGSKQPAAGTKAP